MILLIDIGNTNTTIGFYDNGFKDVLRLKTFSGNRQRDEYLYLLNGFVHHRRMENLEGAVISSVVPDAVHPLVNTFRRGFDIEPLIVNHKIKSGLKFMIKTPEKLGADRIAAAAGARRLYKGHLIVIDFGTATTFCLITSDGRYKGGAIMPGLGISADALTEKTAQLPRVELQAPKKIIGKDTIENILTGLIIGHAGGAERIIKEMRKESGLNITAVATGGSAHLVAPFIKEIKFVNPLLTLEGLRVIYELNL